MTTREIDPLDMEDVRARLGEMWGLGRPITRAELGRALKLSDAYGGEHISKLERGKANLSGPIEVAIRMMLDGAVPPSMDDIVRPGYPRGSTK